MAVSLPFTNPNLSAAKIISLLNLTPHPEGGHYRETFSDEKINDRPASTMIYFLLERGNFSALHRLDAAEGWHFYGGSPISIVEIEDNGAKVTKLGMDLIKGEKPQYVVKKGVWFGSLTDGDWSLVGCTVAPGFLFEKFEMGEREDLVKEFGGCDGWIERLTRS